MNYPIHFKVKSDSASSVEASWMSAAVQSEILTAIPPEFGGPGGGASPEDFYAMALGNCFLATFKVIAAKSKLNYERLIVDVDLSVDFDEEKKLVMKSAQFSIQLHGAENAERALRLLQKTPDHCMILNSVKTTLDFQYRVNE